MTTNVFDGNVGEVATDSRWSIQQGRWLVYVDDISFNKIELNSNAAFVFAGKGKRIQEWKTWIRSNPSGPGGMPPCEGISVCVADVPSKTVLFSARQDIVKDGASFAGTGSRYAYLCWAQNKNPRRSVETAKTLDPASGGEVKFFEFSTGAHNLAQPVAEVTIDMVDKAILTRGNVMDLSPHGKGSAPFQLSPTAAGQGAMTDEERTDLQNKIANGALSAEAPCDGMYSEWSPEERTRLENALAKAFKWQR